MLSRLELLRLAHKRRRGLDVGHLRLSARREVILLALALLFLDDAHRLHVIDRVDDQVGLLAPHCDVGVLFLTGTAVNLADLALALLHLDVVVVVVDVGEGGVGLEVLVDEALLTELSGVIQVH
jgi:hypothetical protein